MRRGDRKEDRPIMVEEHRNYKIYLEKATSKFVVDELEDGPHETVQAARNAIDRHIKGLNTGVRRKVILLSDKYGHFSAADEPRTILEGELTSWTIARGYSHRVEGVLMIDGDRSTSSPDDIFEDTPENRAILAEVIKTDQEQIDLVVKTERLVKSLQRAAMPEHFAKLVKED